MLFLPSSFVLLPSDPASLIPSIIVALYTASLFILFLSAAQNGLLLFLGRRTRRPRLTDPGKATALPVVTVQIPVYNELYVVERCIRAVCTIEHPRELFQVQVLDDSTDETSEIIGRLVMELRSTGIGIEHIRRTARRGFKAGALRDALDGARGEFIAIFDADFVPKPGFLRETLPFFSDPSVAMVQSRWEHLNEGFSPLTRIQAFALDAHFGMEQRIRSGSGHFCTFNGTGGVWRRTAIVDAGGWHDDTLTEDLDLSYRAQLRGWKLLYVNDITTPAELPVDFNAFRMQQYRWTRGYIETARKILPILWRSGVPLGKKVVSTLHLSSHVAFPFILLVAVLNVPVAALQNSGAFTGMMPLLSVFALGFTGTFAYFLQSQRTMHHGWIVRMARFPVFLMGSIGLSVSNAAAVVQGLSGTKGTFIRTAKFGPQSDSSSWERRRYASDNISGFLAVEIPLMLYCFFGVVFSLYQLNFLAVPFQLLFASGFSLVAWMSSKHALMVRRKRTDQGTDERR